MAGGDWGVDGEEGDGGLRRGRRDTEARGDAGGRGIGWGWGEGDGGQGGKGLRSTKSNVFGNGRLRLSNTLCRDQCANK